MRFHDLAGTGQLFRPNVGPSSNRRAADFDIRALVGLVRRQAKFIAASVFVICTVTAIVLFQLTPLYSASTLIMVDPRQQSILDPTGQIALPTDQGRVDSEVEILRSPALLLKIVKDLRLYQDPEYSPTHGLREQISAIFGMKPKPPGSEAVLTETLDRLQRSISVTRVGVTFLIDATVRSRDPGKAAEIANALAGSYIDEQVQAKVDMYANIQDALASRVDEASTALRDSEGKLDDFISSQIDTIADDTTRRDLSDLRNRITARAAENADISKRLAASQAALADRDWQQLVAEVNSESLRALYLKRDELAAAAGNASSDFDLRANLSKLDSQLQSEAGVAVGRLRDTLGSAQSAEEDLRRQLRDLVIRSDLPRTTLVKLYQIQQEAAAGRSVYQDLLTRSKSVDAQRNIQVADSRIVSAALPPSLPSFPKTGLILGLVAGVSLMLGFGLAFLRENYIGGFVSEAQAEQVLGFPVVSSLPRLPSSGAGADSAINRSSEIVEHPLSTYSEAIRRARLALEMASLRHDGAAALQTILVTSALPAEGKTQTAVSIARSFAVSGKRTLLIDSDSRRPNVHRALNIDVKKGVGAYLAEGSSGPSLDEVIVEDALTDLSLILGWQGASDSIFESPRFAELIEAAKARFDYIIMDSSPVLPVVDSRILLRYADAAILVVKWASTSQSEASAALSDLERANRRNVPIGIVLNSSRVGASGYGVHRYYASYYSEG